jgi:uncharacterized protein (DUF362 family)
MNAARTPAPLSRKVSAVRVEDHAQLAAGFRAALQQVPGLLPKTLPRQVIIKPNLCDISPWETGVTTDPRWVGILAAELRAIRPDVIIRVVESDAISAYKSYRSCEETFDRLGYAAAAHEAGVELVNLSRGDAIEIRLDGIPQAVRIPQLLLEEMYLISIANLKLHGYARMTGVLKNSMGLITDAEISSLHPYLSILISRLHKLCPPDLCIIDGRIGLEGGGPIIGRPVRMDTLLVGNDAPSVDAASCRLMGIPPKQVAHLRQTAKDLKRRLGDCEIVGELRPREFVYDGRRIHPAIQTKFANRRLHQRMEALSNRWIDRAYRFRDDPLTFAREAIPKLLGGRRGR